MKKKQVEGGRAGEVVKRERERDRRGGSYVVVYRLLKMDNNNLTQGSVIQLLQRRYAMVT